MSAPVRTIAWTCLGLAIFGHAVAFAALDRWWRIGGKGDVGSPTICRWPDAPDPAPEPPPMAPLPNEPEPVAAAFPEIPRPVEDPLSEAELETLEPSAQREPYECAFSLVAGEPDLDPPPMHRVAVGPGTIGIGAWERWGNVRVRYGTVGAPFPGASDGAAAAPTAAIAPPPAPPPAGETRPPRLAADAAPPVYPLTARRRGWEGVVTLRLEVSANGEVTSVQVLSTSGRSPLDAAAVETARTWRLDPARADGVAVAGTLDVPVRFRLDS